MSAPLSEILRALEAEFSGTIFKDGPEHLAGQAPPSIVAVPMDERFGEPEEYEVQDQPSLAQRDSNVTFSIWGKSRDDVEELIAQLVTALRKVTGHSHQLKGGRWTVQRAEALITHGRAYELQVTFFVPVVASTAVSATVTQTQSTDIAFEVPHA
jgi:hypothetical protein